jgi:hypothetical protein
MNRRAYLFLLVFALALAGCSASDKSTGEPTPTPDNPATRAARAEEDFQGWRGKLEDRGGEFRTAARNAVAEFVKSRLPGWTVKGIASQSYDENVFSMDADLARESQRVVVTFEVRKFFSESGDGYWLAVPVNKYRLDRLHALTDAQLRKELGEAQEQLNNPPEQEEPEPEDRDPY